MPNDDAPIPDEWREAVLQVLRRGRPAEITVTLRAQQEWEAATSAWPHELRDCVAAALSQRGITGKHEPNQPEPGVTYAFWMYHQRVKLFAKVCLAPNRMKLKIISAHTENKRTGRL